ncbi:Wzz/FepE/Etk N-terminal domain-containing protein [Arthrobacter sp. TMN-37]
MELNEYLRIFRRRWVLILVSALCGVIAAGVVTGFIPPKFEAQAVLFIRADSAASSSYENSQFVLQRVKSYPDLVYSPQVLNPVLQELDPSSLTLSELKKRVSASNPEETVYVNVTASAGTPEDSATLANLVAQNLRDVIRQLEGGDTTRNAAVEAFVTVPAVAPGVASVPNPVLNLAIGLLAGLAVGVIAALLLGSAGRRVRHSGDIPRSLGVEMIGTVPESASHGVSSQQAARQYRELLTALLIRRGGQLPKLLMVTSAGQQEDAYDAFGFQFAGCISDSGARTCFIDWADQRVRSDGTGSEVPEAGPGFSEVLLGETTLNDVVSLAGDGATYRIPIGTAAGRISRSQAARQGASILKELSESFDVTLVRTSYDSHPLTTPTVAMVSEAALVLVPYGTRTADLHDCIRELRAVRTEPLGVVLFGGPRRAGGGGRSHAKVRTTGRG